MGTILRRQYWSVVLVATLLLITAVMAMPGNSMAVVAKPTTLPGGQSAAFRLQRQLQSAMTKAGCWQGIVRPPHGLLHHEYLVPGGGYHGLFDWDSYFTAVAMSYQNRGKALAGSVKDFLHFTDNPYGNYRGYTPRQIQWNHVSVLPEMCKPFLAQMALRASLTLHSATWVKPYYQRLADTLWYWRYARRSRDGLFTWFDGWESGVDDSPAVITVPAGGAGNSRVAERRISRPPNRTEGVDLACYIYREYRAMADLAAMLNEPAYVRRYEQRAANLKHLMQTRLWDAHAGIFYNRNSRTGAFIRVPEWTDLTPLWAHMATVRQAHILITRYVLNSHEFWTHYGIRSLAASSPDYHPVHGYLRGPIWVVTDYMVMHGLMNYGYVCQARLLARNVSATLLRDIKKTGGMHENYNPNTGDGQYAGNFKDWDLLGAYMIQEAYTGQDAAGIPTLGQLKALPWIKQAAENK